MSLLKRIETVRGGSPAPASQAEVPASSATAPASAAPATPPSSATPPPPSTPDASTRNGPTAQALSPQAQRLIGQVPVRQPFRDVKFRIQSRVISDLDPKLDLSNHVDLRRRIEETFSRVVDGEGLALTRAERLRMLEQITDEIIGL